MELSVLKTTKGRPMIAYNGYTFTYDKGGLQKHIWKCTYWQKTKCRARIHTTNSFINPVITQALSNHNHEPEPIACEIKKVMGDIKEAANATTLPPTQLIASHVATMSSAAQGMIPLKQNIARSIRVARYREGGSLQIPHRRQDINLPQSFTNVNNKEFLLFDSGPIPERIMNQGLSIVETSSGI